MITLALTKQIYQRQIKHNLKHGCTHYSLEKHEISKLNSNLASNKVKELFSDWKRFSSC